MPTCSTFLECMNLQRYGRRMDIVCRHMISLLLVARNYVGPTHSTRALKRKRSSIWGTHQESFIVYLPLNVNT
ncbi:hypothetical protein VTO42DRAFT_5115 [Malbranchea cinnamomea]